MGLQFMFGLGFLDRLIALHAGTSPIVSQTVLTLMLVVLGIVLVGIGFGYLEKTKTNLLQHRWILSISAGLALAAIALVMLPTTFRFYTDPDVDFYSMMSFTTAIHGIIGIPAIATGLIYAVGRLPRKVRTWMRITALLWIASIILGVYMFLQMMEIV